MTYDATVPNAGQSPGLLPSQANTNFTRLKALINAEHVFNDTAAVDDGVHRQMTLVDRTDPVALPAGTNFMTYSASSKFKGYNGINTFFYLPVIASVKFSNTGSPVISAGSINVTSVVKNSTGNYTVNFTNALPSINGGWSINPFASNTDIIVAMLFAYSTTAITIKHWNVVTNQAADGGFTSVVMYYGG